MDILALYILRGTTMVLDTLCTNFVQLRMEDTYEDILLHGFMITQGSMKYRCITLSRTRRRRGYSGRVDSIHYVYVTDNAWDAGYNVGINSAVVGYVKTPLYYTEYRPYEV